MTIGKRFKTVRESTQERIGKKLTQSQMSERLGISRDALANIENDRNPPQEPVVQLLAERFDVNEEWLRTGKGKMFADPPKDELDMLLDKRGFTRKEKAFLRYVYELPKADMDAIVSVAENLGELLSQVEDVENELDEIDAEVEAYRQELISAREAKKQSESGKSVG